MQIQTITVHRLARDEWGYPVAHWSGDGGARGGTRIPEKADAESIVAAVAAQFAYAEGDSDPAAQHLETAVLLAPDLRDER